MLNNRTDAGYRLADLLRDRVLRHPVVLAIPRGGAVVGAVLARELGAELDVVLSRKLRAPDQPELAIGAVAEGGEVYLDPRAVEAVGVDEAYVAEERRRQMVEIARRQKLFRAVRPQASLADRSVIVVDDGIATGSTVIAALQAVRTQHPFEIILAVPVASRDRLEVVGRLCDEVVCVETPSCLWSVGQFYDDFREVEDWEAVNLLRKHVRESAPAAAGTK